MNGLNNIVSTYESIEEVEERFSLAVCKAIGTDIKIQGFVSFTNLARAILAKLPPSGAALQHSRRIFLQVQI